MAAGATDVGIDYEPEVFLAQQQHVPVVAVASVAPEALASIIAPGSSGIHTPADLRGKTIGVDGTGSTTAFVETVLRHAGVSPSQVTLRNIGFNQVPDLLQHQVDAVAGVFQNIEGIQFAQRGLHPVVFPYDRYGVPAYDELVLVANREPAHVRRGLPAPGRALRRGARSGHPLGAGPPGRRNRGHGAPRLPRLHGHDQGQRSGHAQAAAASAR